MANNATPAPDAQHPIPTHEHATLAHAIDRMNFRRFGPSEIAARIMTGWLTEHDERVRSDERVRIARAIEAELDAQTHFLTSSHRRGFCDAAHIARGGDDR